jgi:glycerophosphoryl diester phosphodiesterase
VSRRAPKPGWVTGLVAAGAWLALVGCDPPGLGRSNPNFLVVGHHGAPNLAAENTLRSYEAAVAVGANAIETDFCITSDHVIVAFHDCDPDSSIALARQAGGEGYAWLPFVPPVNSPWRRPVSQLTLKELREHYGYRVSEGSQDSDATIPTLKDVLRWCGETNLNRAASAKHDAETEPRLKAVYLDLKFGPSEVAAAVQLLGELWDAWQLADVDGGTDTGASLRQVQFYLLNVHVEVIDALKKERARLGADPLRVVWDFEKPGALSATTGAGLRDVSTGLTPSFTWSGYKREIAHIVEARENGAIDSVLAWTFDRKMQLAELLYYSVDGVITNDPATVHRMWQDTLQ